ncbi:MAG: alpha/beta fold hydrolase [Actinomycetota bacterium]|nr:alpha/beta fold hydrolase [Actinomycetota bacterium]
MPTVNKPVLQVHAPNGPVRAVALVLHGGRSKGLGRVNSLQLAVLRMRPFVSGLRRAGADDGLAVASLRYAVRGWNGAAKSPVPDAQWALDQLTERFPDTPVALVGHSMGGRAALHVAGHPSVRAVVGLAPWLEPGDPVAQLAGRRVLIVHGALDRMTDPSASAAYARAAESVAATVTYVRVQGERHAMLRRAAVWHRLASGFVLAVVCGRPPRGTASDQTTNVLSMALAGQAALVV